MTLAAGMTMAACGPRAEPTLPPATPSPVVDTWVIGRAIGCADWTNFGMSCADLLVVARDGYDSRDPGHAPIVSWTFHDEGLIADPETGRGRRILRSGACCLIVVFELADGRVGAIGIGAPGTGGVKVVPNGPAAAQD